ncbi:MAG: type VI secretion system Vgr family protein [Pelagibaca sp.]
MFKKPDPSNFPLRLEGAPEVKKLLPISARVTEQISRIPTIEVHFYSDNEDLPLDDIVGKSMHLVAESEDKSSKRWFRGTCVSAEFVALLDVGGHFKAEVRPWLWFLTRRTDLRIYQNMKVVEIIQAVLQEYGFSGNLKLKLSHSYETREYCVQYRETDLDFIDRLMQEEGIYYYFDHTPDTEEMVLIDDMGKHVDIAAPSTLKYREYSMRSTNETAEPFVFSWSGQEKVRSAKLVLEDYNFTNSTATLTSENQTTRKKHYLQEQHERYDYPGHFREAGLGEHRARVRMEAEAVAQHTVSGVSDAINMAVGCLFKIEDLPRTKGEPKEVLLLECAHEIVQLEAFDEGFFDGAANLAEVTGVSPDTKEPHLVRFVAMDAEGTQYRAPFRTPWPTVGGIHTALVTGPKKEEIHTDEYGRIKVQFHWDRDGEHDDNTTCWVRTMMPWTGKNWGAIAIPRIGQEVVISFEEGDPDRPVCIGMLYNDKTMPPYALPENKTQSGVKTNSTKGGGGFNELMFEDKKGEELVRFQSEKDYEQIVHNDSTITVGLDKKSPGNLSTTVHKDLSETINTGNHSTLVKQGDLSIDVKMGKITVTAMKSIEFKCGGSTIKMDPQSIKIKSPMVTVQADMKADVKSPMTTVKGDMMLTLKGGVVMIN